MEVQKKRFYFSSGRWGVRAGPEGKMLGKGSVEEVVGAGGYPGGRGVQVWFRGLSRQVSIDWQEELKNREKIQSY